MGVDKMENEKYNNNCICPGSQCKIRNQCRYSRENYWTWNDNLKWAQVEDWSVQGSCTVYTNPITGKNVIEEKHWCGDLSENYPYFKDIGGVDKTNGSN